MKNVFEMLDMQKDKNIPIQSRKNCVTILGLDPLLSGKIKFNTLSNRKSVDGALPWNKSTALRDWSDIDTEYLLYYIESYYLINSDKKVLSALEMVADVNKFNPFVDMLNSVTWDRIPRIENLLTDYLGVEKNEYSAECMKLLMLGVISRAFCPGTKFDYVIVVSGPQGIGKSTFFMKLCCNDEWYLENLKNIRDEKEAGEKLQGKILVEFNELLAFKSSVEDIKSFITITSDEYRGAYKREKEKRKRTCAFVGTTNNSEFLVDKTGNRRFLPLECGVVSPTKSLFGDEQTVLYEFKQAWAEAYEIYKSGKFSLVLPKRLDELVEQLQEEFKEDDPLVGTIQKWLNENQDEYVCNLQIASEILKEDNPDRKTLLRIAEIMNHSVKGWKKGTGKKTIKHYGRQKYYEKVDDFIVIEDEKLPFD